MSEDDFRSVFDQLAAERGGAERLTVVEVATLRQVARLLIADDPSHAGAIASLLAMVRPAAPSAHAGDVRVDPERLNRWQRDVVRDIVSCLTDKPFEGRPRTKAADVLARLNTNWLQPDEVERLAHLISRCCNETWVTPRSFRWHAAIRLADVLDTHTVKRGVQWVSDPDAVAEIAGWLAMLLDNLSNVRPAARRRLVPLLAAWRESEGLPLASSSLQPPEQTKADNVVPLQRPATPVVGLGEVGGVGAGPVCDTSHWGKW
jgi:hypothetical protein